MASFRRFRVKEPRHSETVSTKNAATSIVAHAVCCNQNDPSIVKDLDGRICPLLGDFSRSPHVDAHVVKASDESRGG